VKALAATSLRLGELEVVIERGKSAFVKVGLALLEIRDARLYRETHGTFEEYCRERWGWTRVHANRQIQAAVFVESLEPGGSKPKTEGEARQMMAAVRAPPAIELVEDAPAPRARCAHCDIHCPRGRYAQKKGKQ
jgi:hypothetical protein